MATPEAIRPKCRNCERRLARSNWRPRFGDYHLVYRDDYCWSCGDDYCCNCNEHRDDHVVTPNDNGNMKLTCLFNSTRWKSYQKKWKQEDVKFEEMWKLENDPHV